MRAMLTAFAVTILIAFGADYVLHQLGFSSAERQSSANVRLK